MPWLWVGRYCFDLNRVELVERAVGPEGGVTITLLTGKAFDLSGEEERSFLIAWEEHTAARRIERGPPRVLTPTLIRPGDPSGRAGEADA